MATIGNTPLNINNPDYFNQGIYGISNADSIGLPSTDLLRPEDSQLFTEVGQKYQKGRQGMDEELRHMIEPQIKHTKTLTPFNFLMTMRAGAQSFQQNGHSEAAAIVEQAAKDNNLLFEIRAQLLGA